MSLILEALRKSEAERRLGSAPDLLRAMPVLRASAPRSRWPLTAACAAALLALLMLAWWWAQGTRPVPPSSTRSAAQESHSVHASRIDSNAWRNTSPPPIATQAPSPRTAASKSQIAETPLASAPVRPAMIPPVSPVSRTPASPAIRSARQAVAAIPAAIAPAPALQTPADEPALLSLADLGTDERNGLPTLKVSMHVYADDPARRFMIIDGQRVGEGALLADGVVLVRIRRDGAELDVRGRRVLLPKP